MMKAVIITENESDCNIAKEYGFNSIFLNESFVSDGSTECMSSNNSDTRSDFLSDGFALSL